MLLKVLIAAKSRGLISIRIDIRNINIKEKYKYVDRRKKKKDHPY